MSLRQSAAGDGAWRSAASVEPEGAWSSRPAVGFCSGAAIAVPPVVAQLRGVPQPAIVPIRAFGSRPQRPAFLPPGPSSETAPLLDAGLTSHYQRLPEPPTQLHERCRARRSQNMAERAAKRQRAAVDVDRERVSLDIACHMRAPADCRSLPALLTARPAPPCRPPVSGAGGPIVRPR